MKTRSAALVSFVSLAALCAWPRAGSAQEPADGAPPALTAADIDEMFERVSNWGRWAADDQRGTLNLITPEKRRQAAALVREGISVSLSQDLSAVEAVDNTMPLELVMTAQAGSPVAMDELRIFYHGLTYAHRCCASGTSRCSARTSVSMWSRPGWKAW